MNGVFIRFTSGFVLIIALGTISHFVGEAIPRKFVYMAFPFKSCKWEKEGTIYNKLNIRKWLHKLPDKSKYVKSMVPKELDFHMHSKDIEHNIQESCVAEAIHWILFFCSGLFLLIGQWVGTLFCTLYALSHVPYIMIQRYLRPQLIKLYERKERLERKLAFENTDFDVQHG